jgi:hypothetical protein
MTVTTVEQREFAARYPFRDETGAVFVPSDASSMTPGEAGVELDRRVRLLAHHRGVSPSELITRYADLQRQVLDADETLRYAYTNTRRDRHTPKLTTAVEGFDEAKLCEDIARISSELKGVPLTDEYRQQVRSSTGARMFVQASRVATYEAQQRVKAITTEGPSFPPGTSLGAHLDRHAPAPTTTERRYQRIPTTSGARTWFTLLGVPNFPDELATVDVATFLDVQALVDDLAARRQQEIGKWKARNR